MKSRIVKAAAVAMVVGTLAAGSVSVSVAGLGGGQNSHFQASTHSKQYVRAQEPSESKRTTGGPTEILLTLLRALIGIR